MKTIEAIFKLARPKQWVKNIFVFTTLIFTGKALEAEAILETLVAFFSFCLASSAVYFLNDFKDAEEDKRHPTKKSRPLASGSLPKSAGLVGSLILMVGSVVVAFMFINTPTVFVIGLYLFLNIGYSLGFKNVVIIDVLVIAAGFVLRIMAGVTTLSVMPSTWLILCAVTISLFLGFTKRRAEVILLGDDAKNHRKVLKDYSTAFLDQMISVVTAATVLAYILYTMDDQTVQLVGSRALIFSVPLVLYGIFRYLYLVYHAESGSDPTRTVFTDIPLIITGAIWGLVCTAVIQLGGDLSGFTSWFK